METRSAWNPEDVKTYTTDRIRREFLIDGIFTPGAPTWVYCMTDRMIVGGICPVKPVTLPPGDQLKAKFFLERREMGILNLGPKGRITVDGKSFEMNTRDCLYAGMGSKEVSFESADPRDPARFYALSAPAHKAYPVTHAALSSITPVKLGTPKESNVRSIYKYIQPGAVASCQLVMGLTMLEPGSVWNSMPCHTHDRRMEVYLYFDLADGAVVFHMMGEPGETRHVVMKSGQAVISPSWSIHSGVGTSNYSFVWGMAGENQEFTDMDGIKTTELR